MDKYLVVMAGAGFGGLARYAAATWISKRLAGSFPAGTFAVNVSGSFLIGLLMTLLTEQFRPHPNLRLFLVVGFLGGYTTFSSLQYETLQAVRTGERWIALLYVSGSVILGYLAVWLGMMMARR